MQNLAKFFGSNILLLMEGQDDAVQLMHQALTDAMHKYPHWPTHPLAGEAIIAEEVGEAVKATQDSIWKGTPLRSAIEEHAQAAAMHIRQMQYLLYLETVPETVDHPLF